MLFFRRHKSLSFATGILFTLAIGFIDYITGYKVALSVFYLAPIGFVTWFVGRRAGFFASVFSVITSSLSDYAAGKIYTHLFIELWNVFLPLVFFLIFTWLLSELKSTLEKRERLVLELEQIKEALERKKDELEHSNAELNQFAMIVSHDLRSPLGTVGNFITLLERKYGAALDAKAHEYIFFAREGIKRMEQLISGLLYLARAGRPETVFARVDCNAVLRQALSNLGRDMEESGASVEAAGLPALDGDETQLVQLFQNLLGNGIKYRRAGVPPVIRVRAEPRSGEWLFSIKDNGIGIKQEFLKRIFEPLQRLHTRAEYPGTGLGLSICKKIVKRHGGDIWAESVPGGGSTFYFTLPKK
ncbi:MAG: ATP-binding protein [Nitrospiraceae bacterium]|nr:ATP-binding protein [Nitrospiraceae bacterium]